jgi:hypothetical protein
LQAADLKEHPMCPHCGYRPVEEPLTEPAGADVEGLAEKLGQLHAAWTSTLLDSLQQVAVQDSISLMSTEHQKALRTLQEGGALPYTVGYDLVQTVKEALAGLERVAVPPEDILAALVDGGMPCTVPELEVRFNRLVKKLVADKDPGRVRIVIDW